MANGWRDRKFQEKLLEKNGTPRNKNDNIWNLKIYIIE